MPPSSLVICSRNRPHLLAQAVESVLGGAVLPNELVVVDQSERPNEALTNLTQHRDCRIHYLWTARIGASSARNEGAAAASHEILAFIDDDILVPPDWYARLVRALVQAGPGSVITGRVLPGDIEVAGGFVPAVVERMRPGMHAGRIGTDVLVGCHFALYRSTFEAVGGLDERLGPGSRFPGAEDNDLGFRLLEAGCRIIYAPDCVVYHRAWRSGRSYLPLRWAYGRGQGAFYAKHLSVRDGYVAGRLLRDVGLRVLRFPWRFAHRPRLAIGDLVFTCGILSGSGEWLARRLVEAHAR